MPRLDTPLALAGDPDTAAFDTAAFAAFDTAAFAPRLTRLILDEVIDTDRVFESVASHATRPDAAPSESDGGFMGGPPSPTRSN